ncbi:MAG: CZB domain-containing protein [Opitutales bacterium]
MNIQPEINKAIGAHGMWKQRLRGAVNTGKSEFSVAVVCQDNQCEFGKWLYALEPQVKASKHWVCVKSLHADFHREAAGVLGLALSGKKSEAEAALSESSKFNLTSMKLTVEMMAWAKAPAA